MITLRLKIAASVETQMLWEHYFVRRHVMTSLVVFVLMRMNIKIAIQMVAQVLQKLHKSYHLHKLICLSTQLTVSGVHGVHGKPALKPVVVALKKETGQSVSQPYIMVPPVLETIQKYNPAIVTAAQVMLKLIIRH